MRQTLLISAFLLLLPIGTAAAPADDLNRLAADVARAERLDRNEDDGSESFEEIDASLAANREFAARLEKIPLQGLSERERVTHDMLAWFLSDQAVQIGFVRERNYFPLDPVHSRILGFAREMQWRARYGPQNARDERRGIGRIRAFARFLARAEDKMRQGIKAGYTYPRFVVDMLIAQNASLGEAPLGEGPFKAGEAYRNAVTSVAGPAFRKMAAFLRDEYAPHARNTIGLMVLPRGKEMYRAAVAHETTSALSPDDIHDMGLKALASIEAEMETVKIASGFSGTLSAFKSSLKNDPRFSYPAESDMLRDAARIENLASRRFDEYFSRRPRAKLEFRPMEDALAPGKPLAEYSPPSRDFARPGIVYLNTTRIPNYIMQALVLHEAMPGHHLQASLAMELENIPRFRRAMTPSSFIEGWGLYAEGMGDELGLYREPYAKFGMLAFAAWRASRLVVDTGIHAKSWTLETAREFLRDHTMLSEADIDADIARVISIPGQALSYHVGAEAFRRLKENAAQALGPGFDVKAFHEALLNEGALTLPALEAHMARWLSGQAR